MPGFNIAGGDSEFDPSNTSGKFTDVHRAHRWHIEQLGPVTRGKNGPLLYAKTLQLPSYTIEEEVVPGAAVKYKFAKMVNWDDVAVSFYDVHGALNPLFEWQVSVFDQDVGIQPANSYKDTCIFRLTDGLGNNADGYVLHGSWPKTISHSPLSYESSDLKLINLTISYDFATYTFGRSTARS